MTRILAILFILAGVAGPVSGADPTGHAHHGPAADAPAPARPEGRGGLPRTMGWTSSPLLLSSGGMGRGSGRFAPQNLAAEQVEVYGPGAVSQATVVPVEQGAASVAPVDPKLGNYHWLVARERRPGEERTASTAWYVSNPGPSPTRLLAEYRPGLAVVPRLPREHGGYREGDMWNFQVRFDGQPVPGAVLTLETEFGTRTRAVADQNGWATVAFPRDFDPAKVAAAGEHGRASGRFVVSTEQEREGVRHVSAFNGAYSPDPGRNRNLAAGAGFLLLGMAAAAPLLRRRQEKK